MLRRSKPANSLLKTVQQITDKVTLRKVVNDWRRRGKRLAFVPTMGNLHAGHLALVQKAIMLADKTIVSIFVNPTQFGDGEDFDSYPRTLDADSMQLAAIATDLLFVPGIDEIYPSDSALETRVTVPKLSTILCGRSRPKHFTGVATVINKLLNIVNPDIAIFGEKDYQQLVIIKKMIADLCLPVEIVNVATVREDSGLALSSRNHYMSAAEKALAPELYRTLTTVADHIQRGNDDYRQLEADVTAKLNDQGFRTDYIAIRNAADLEPPKTGDIVMLAAAWLGAARLIDNVLIKR